MRVLLRANSSASASAKATQVPAANGSAEEPALWRRVRLCTEPKLGGAIPYRASDLDARNRRAISSLMCILVVVAICFPFLEAARKRWIIPVARETATGCGFRVRLSDC